MAHQHRTRHQDPSVTGIENIGLSRHAGIPSTPALSDTKVHNVPAHLYLRELSAGALQNVKTPQRETKSFSRRTRSAATLSAEVTTPDSLAEDLSNFHIHSPSGQKDSVGTELKGAAVRRPTSFDHYYSSPSQTHKSHKAKRTHLTLPEESSHDIVEETSVLKVEHSSFHELLSQPEIQSTIKRHDVQDFDWILSLPRDAGDSAESKQLRRTCSAADLAASASHRDKVYFGCNILRQISLSRSSVTGSDREVNTYTLIATPLTSRKEVNGPRDSNRQVDSLSPSLRLTSPVVADMPSTEAGGDFSKASMLSPNPVPVGRQQSSPRSPSGSVARIEDTLEELDRLEDEFEAVHSIVRVSRVATPDKEVYDKASTNLTKSLDTRNSTHNLQPTEVRQATSVRRSIGAAKPAEKSIAAGTSSASPFTNTTRLSLARPRSLLPPKPSAKSRKPLTVSTFELPGEAISRRKREELEAKVKQQMKEEQKRREFKARPIRLNNTPTSVPRETISSRARTNRASVDSEGATAKITLSVPNSAPQAIRRRSEVSSELSDNTRLDQTPRGRGTSVKRLSTLAESVSRATSTSTCSVSGKRSTFLSDEVQNQKLRGREILQRDSILSLQREREKQEREAITKQARQQAAERSRALSREWAEKQKLKAKITATAAAKS